MNYDETLQYIHSLNKFGSAPGLERVSALLEILGNPQDGVPCVHVAGTSGKGSTSAIIASVLTAAGYRTGLFVSPNIEDFRERIQINAEMITKDALRELTEEVKAASEKLAREKQLQVTEFEFVTALGYLHFKRAKADIAVIEVGLGGRFDATNVIKSPLVSVITPISLDHTEILGNTITAVAGEKAGIIKNGRPVVTSRRQHPEAFNIINSTAAARETRVFTADGLFNVVSAGLRGTVFNYEDETYNLSLAGAHQTDNALTALKALDLLESFTITREAKRKGLSAVKLPGRFEIVRKEPICIIDGAHNSEKINALYNTLQDLMNNTPLTVIMGMSADKDTAYCIPKIASLASCFIGVAAVSARGKVLSPGETASLAKPCCGKVFAAESMERAAEIALSNTAAGGAVIACGSMYFLSDAKRCLCDV